MEHKVTTEPNANDLRILKTNFMFEFDDYCNFVIGEITEPCKNVRGSIPMALGTETGPSPAVVDTAGSSHLVWFQ